MFRTASSAVSLSVTVTCAATSFFAPLFVLATSDWLLMPGNYLLHVRASDVSVPLRHSVLGHMLNPRIALLLGYLLVLTFLL